jgi:lysozyme
MGRKKAFPWRWRLAAALLLLALGGGAWLWWQFLHWTPERSEFPVQGVLVSEGDDVSFTALAAIGTNFVYLEASKGADGRDPGFGENLEQVREAGLQYGVVHEYDPCEPAEEQAANFVTIVPRDDAMLPPAIALDALAENCGVMVSDGGVESELTTFLNQVESHVGKPALLKLSPAFQERYRIASRMDRSLWLNRDVLQPDYAGRPWALWTANSWLRTEAGEGPVHWVVAQN